MESVYKKMIIVAADTNAYSKEYKNYWTALQDRVCRIERIQEILGLEIQNDLNMLIRQKLYDIEECIIVIILPIEKLKILN